ncbi:MAG: DeoR/GlpR family DNA-binding transcription regulator [Alicyclobacillus sp.]|nr:DeoR/GlpR family DNA-binding transcription regulator [Alicyclobacillus sp.]
MYPAERRTLLLKLLNERGFVSIRDLAVQLEVSEITIRRDLKVLQRQGLVEKVLGGGQVTKSTVEPPFLHKRVLQQREKEAIARRALGLIESGMTVGLSAGTTTWTLAQMIQSAGKTLTDLTFVTNSTNVAGALHANGWTDIYLTGGQFRTPSDALVGPLAERSARQLHTDLFFLGAHGVDLEFGVTSPNLPEAAIHRVMMERAEAVALLFDHTKWSVRGLAHLARIEEVDVVVTDNGKPVDTGDGVAPDAVHEWLTELRMLGPEVCVVQMS